jgi:hypothetical protein
VEDSPIQRAGASISIQAVDLKGPVVVIMATTGLFFVWPPLRCPVCRGMHTFLRNAGGRTLCVWCQEAAR